MGWWKFFDPPQERVFGWEFFGDPQERVFGWEFFDPPQERVFCAYVVCVGIVFVVGGWVGEWVVGLLFLW